jgi:hypothetical protein
MSKLKKIILSQNNFRSDKIALSFFYYRLIYSSSESSGGKTSLESRLDNNFEGVVSDGLFSFKFSSDIFIGRGGSFEGFVFSFEFNFGVSEILGSDGEESFLGVDSVDDNLEFTGGNDVLFGVISVFLLSGSDFSFEFSLESVFFVVISLEIVLDSRFDVFEGFEDSEEGRLISEFFGGELNEGLDEDFIGALGEGIDDL